MLWLGAVIGYKLVCSTVPSNDCDHVSVAAGLCHLQDRLAMNVFFRDQLRVSRQQTVNSLRIAFVNGIEEFCGRFPWHKGRNHHRGDLRAGSSVVAEATTCGKDREDHDWI